MPYKVAIIGAARRHQGTGPYIARHFAKLGHTICGIVGTSQSSIDNALTQLSNQFGIFSQGYSDFAVLIEEKQPDIVAICSPSATHLEYLQKALANNLHVFCEKPLYWPDSENQNMDQHTYEDTINDLLALARQKQRYIHLNTQWPYTLKFFNQIHPEALKSNHIKQFAMHLSPQSQGKKMIVDAGSHGLSMLYALVGEGTIENIRVKHSAEQQTQIDFDYQHSQGCTQTTFGLKASQAVPKPASYVINGFNVDRGIVLPEYQITLQSERQTVPIDDPLDASIDDFLACIEAKLTCDDTMLLLGARHLYQLIENY